MKPKIFCGLTALVVLNMGCSRNTIPNERFFLINEEYYETSIMNSLANDSTINPSELDYPYLSPKVMKTIQTQINMLPGLKKEYANLVNPNPTSTQEKTHSPLSRFRELQVEVLRADIMNERSSEALRNTLKSDLGSYFN